MAVSQERSEQLRQKAEKATDYLKGRPKRLTREERDLYHEHYFRAHHDPAFAEACIEHRKDRYRRMAEGTCVLIFS